MEPQRALGRLCRDIVLEHQGVCTRIDDYLYGCRTYYLQKPGITEKGISVQEECLEILDDSIVGSIPVNRYYAPTLLGHEVQDKITKRGGICIARCFPFTGSPQYLVESIPEDKEKDPVLYCMDEARLEVIEDSPNAINPDDVQGKHKGGAAFAYAPRIVTL